MNEKLKSKFENDMIIIWETLISHFDGIKNGLEKIKKLRGKLSTKDHQLTINQVIKKIYEVM